MSEVLKIKEALSFLKETLAKGRPQAWLQSAETWYDDVEQYPNEVIKEILGCYAGMTSFNDFYIHKDGVLLQEENTDLDNLRNKLWELCADYYTRARGADKYPSLSSRPQKRGIEGILEKLQSLQEIFVKKDCQDISNKIILWKESFLKNPEVTLKDFVGKKDLFLFDEELLCQIIWSEEENIKFLICRSDFYNLCNKYYNIKMAIKRYPTLFSEEDL